LPFISPGRAALRYAALAAFAALCRERGVAASAKLRALYNKGVPVGNLKRDHPAWLREQGIDLCTKGSPCWVAAEARKGAPLERAPHEHKPGCLFGDLKELQKPSSK